MIPGKSRYQRAGLVVHFYDSVRKPVGDVMIGLWNGTSDWKELQKQVDVPRTAREMIIRIGLNGAQGRACVDDVRMTSTARR